MTKVRIRCRVPAQERIATGIFAGVSSGRLADWSDVEVFAVDEAGAEMALTNVDAIEFKMAAGCEPARVVLTMLQPELDIEGEADAPDVVQRGIAGNDAGPGEPVQLGRFMWPAGERLEAGQACELRSDSRVYPARAWAGGTLVPLTPSRSAPGSRTAIEQGLEAVIDDACPNVGGFELYPTREGTLRIALRGRGITPAEVNAVHAAAAQLVPVAIVPLVEVSESDREAAGWARWSADEIARFLRGDPPVKP